ncbi:MAG: OadG family protein [Clostridia bacterium]|nr:OadG family protein [Clostridia bacterium]
MEDKMNLLANYPTLKFTMGEVALYAVLGFSIVLIVLCFLMGMIKLLSFVVNKIEAKATKAMPATAAPAVETAPAIAPGRSGKIKLFDVPDREAAMIMAIVADQLQEPLANLNFISIKEVKDGKEE